MKSKLLMFLAALTVSAFATTAQAQNVTPYLPMQNDFGGTAVTNLATFEPSLNQFTLEVTASAVGTPVSIGMLSITYTPTTSTEVRFVLYKGKVYIYEGGEYKETQTPAGNLLLNPGFELGTTVGAGTNNWNAYDATPTLSWNNTTGAGSVRNTEGSIKSGTYSLLMRDPFVYLTQNLPAGKIKPNTNYKVAYYARMFDNNRAIATYQLELGSTERGVDYGTVVAHTSTNATYTEVIRYIQTNDLVNESEDVWFCLHRTTKTRNDAYDWVDDFSLVAIGISGAASAQYAADVVAAPEGTTPNYTVGDVLDMYPHFLINPEFDLYTGTGNNVSYTGWSNTVGAQQTKLSTGAKGNPIVIEAAPNNHWQLWSGNAMKGKISQGISNLPNGKYKVSAAIVATSLTTISIYANEGRKTIGNNGFHETTGIVIDGTLEIGLDINLSAGQTVDFDHFSLHYLGPNYTTFNNGAAAVTGEITPSIVTELGAAGITSVDLTNATATGAVILTFDNPNTLVYNVPENVTTNGIEISNGAFVGEPSLTDLKPFAAANGITGAISYQRAFTGVANGATGGWEVFNVPFKVTSVKATINGTEYDYLPYTEWYAADDATVEGKGFFWIKKATSGSNAISTSVENLSAMEANEPYLIAFPKTTIEGHPQFNVNGETFTFSGNGVEATITLQPTQAGNFNFLQSYLGGTVQNAYLLNAAGDAFVKEADATVIPFRPFVTFGNPVGVAPSQFLINGNNDVTNIEEVKARLAAAKMIITTVENGVTIYSENEGTVLVYDLNGALVKSVAISNGENFVSLPAGTYVINNKTVIVK